MLMKDSCLLIGGKSHGALVSAIFNIMPVMMKTCSATSTAKFWLRHSNSLTKKYVEKELKNLQKIVFCKRRLHGGYRVIKF